MSRSFYEESARQRIEGLLDPQSFVELLKPTERLTSPHLQALESPVAFDDGVIVGRGSLADRPVLIGAEEGGFNGGAVGEVHGAKLTGLLERALDERPAAVLLLIDSGGVRLHEANAGLIGVSEIMQALLACRAAGIPVLGLIGGRSGAFGGMGIVSRLCDALVMSEEGRLGLSGPEVIETSCGVEEFDSRDRALVWRTVGGKHRYLLGEIDRLVEDDIGAFRSAALALLDDHLELSLDRLEQEHARLGERLNRFGDCHDAREIWQRLGIEDPAHLPLLETARFLAVTADKRG
jgi:malonate decarboxylase beta subunit